MTGPAGDNQSLPCARGEDRGNDLPVLNELRHALTALLERGEATVIDTKSLPFGPHDETRLRSALGEGEVQATVNALGESRITETAFPGIWWVEHRNPQGEVVAQFLEVTYVPGILESQRDDVIAGRDLLNAWLDSPAAKDNEQADEKLRI